jgi:hypothetical protein
VCAILVLVFNLTHLGFIRHHTTDWTTYTLLPFLQILSCAIKMTFHPQKYAAAGATADDYVQATYHTKKVCGGVFECIMTKKTHVLGEDLLHSDSEHVDEDMAGEERAVIGC